MKHGRERWCPHIANPDINVHEGTIVSDSITVADRLINALNEQDEDEEDAS